MKINPFKNENLMLKTNEINTLKLLEKSFINHNSCIEKPITELSDQEQSDSSYLSDHEQQPEQIKIKVLTMKLIENKTVFSTQKLSLNLPNYFIFDMKTNYKQSLHSCYQNFKKGSKFYYSSKNLFLGFGKSCIFYHYPPSMLILLKDLEIPYYFDEYLTVDNHHLIYDLLLNHELGLLFSLECFLYSRYLRIFNKMRTFNSHRIRLYER